MRIGFPLVDRAPYIDTDLAILGREHEVVLLGCKSLGQLFRSMLAIPKIDCLYCWFASFRFLPLILIAKLFGKGVVAVVAGYDVASHPNLNYGNLRPGIRRLVGRTLFRFVDRIMAVSDFCRSETIRNANTPKEKVVTIPLGFDLDQWPDPGPRRGPKPLVLTVAPVDRRGILVKGVGDYCAVATRVTEAEFACVGPVDEPVRLELDRQFGGAVKFLGQKSQGELKRLYGSATVYMQLSAQEGFCCAAAEAMMCGCRPVVSNAGGLPELIGDAGSVIPLHDVEAAAEAVVLALHSDRAPSGRRRVAARFTLERRTGEIRRVLEEVTGHATTLAETRSRA